jgi:hypothetical protein
MLRNETWASTIIGHDFANLFNVPVLNALIDF